jgi:hypothetical protein
VGTVQLRCGARSIVRPTLSHRYFPVFFLLSFLLGSGAHPSPSW